MRVKKGVKARRRRNRVLKLAKGFRGRRKNCYTRANQAVERALDYATRDRRRRRREFRALWIVRINAAARLNGTTYSRLAGAMQQGRRGARPQGPRRDRALRCRPTSRPWSRPPRPRAEGTWTWSADLEALAEGARQSIAVGARRAGARGAAGPLPRQEGRALRRAARHGAARGRGAPARRRGRQPGPRRGRVAAGPGARQRIAERPARGRAAGLAHRRDPAGPAAAAARPPPPGHPDHRGDRRHLRAARATRWRAARRSSSTGTTSRPSTSRPTTRPATCRTPSTSTRPRWRAGGEGRGAAAHPHLARPDPGHEAGRASRRSASCAPGRVYRSRLRPDPLAHVPPGRGALRGRRASPSPT